MINISKLIVIRKKERPSQEEFRYMLKHEEEFKDLLYIVKSFLAQKEIYEGNKNYENKH